MIFWERNELNRVRLASTRENLLLKKIKNTLFILIVLFAVGCRFNKPFPSIRTTKYIKENSDINVTQYKYFRISRYGLLGHIHIEKKFNTEGDLVEKSIHKYSALVRDGFMKIHRKTIIYSKKGNRKSIHLKISKGIGRGGEKSILDKLILFDDNGKMKKTINNIEK